MLYALLATGCGAFLGACLRYAFGLALNPIFPTIPIGTLTANLLGGLIMGLTLGAFEQFSALSPELRLFITTGFLGGLTTFSTFSAEITTLLMRKELLWSALGVAAHVVGSIVMTVVGIVIMRALLTWGTHS